jgi:hypothetical protein
LDQSTRSAASEWIAAFVQRLRELGWIENRTVAIDYRWGEGREERFAEVADEFVRLKVDVIVTSGTPAVLASKQATSVIPIIFATAGDPVGNNLVASLAQPGGNVTGLSLQMGDLAGKFRALALFGRRSPQRVARSALPASENLHKTRNRGLVMSARRSNPWLALNRAFRNLR